MCTRLSEIGNRTSRAFRLLGAVITSIVQWSPRPVTFGVEKGPGDALPLDVCDAFNLTRCAGTVVAKIITPELCISNSLGAG